MKINYHLSPIETSRIRVEVNSQSLTDLSASLEIKSAVLYFGCSLYPTIWIFELKEDVGDSKLHRPVCLVNKGIRMSNDSDVSIYSNGAVNGYEMGHRKTRIHLEKCPEKYQNERNLCGYGEAAVCQGDFGSGLVAQIDNRNYLAGVLTYKDSISDKLQCNGTVPGYKIPLVFISIEPLLDLICSEIGVCDASSNDGNNGGEITVITPKPIPACGGNQSETTVDNNNNDIKITVTAPEPLAIGTDIGKDVGTQTNDPSVLTVNIHINA
uniref:Peptidase S1 domain-containing protein n=1 Tax=Caenorhabditis tropicalis TaxID=1561998 RepID=A0A1I7UJ53_9PELO